LPIALFNISWPHSVENWMALIIGVLFIFLTDLTAFFSLKHTEASLYQIVGQLRHVIVLFGAFLLFAEPIIFYKVLSIIFIILGVTIALLEKSKIAITKGIIYAFLSTVCIAIAFLFIKKTAAYVNPAFLASISLIISGLLTYVVFLISDKQQVKLFNKAVFKLIVYAAVTFAAFELTSFTALAIGEASRVTPVSQSSMIFTLMGGYIFLNEKANLKKKIIGCILIVLGIGLLYFV